MARTTLAALLFASATAFAQTAPSSTTAADPKAPTTSPATTQPGSQRTPATALPSTPAPSDPAAPAATRDEEAIRREVETRVEQAKKELREELRAQLAAEAAGAGWQEEATEERRKLELFVLDGYFRSRPDLFHKFDLARQQESDSFSQNRVLWDKRTHEQTIAGVNMRARFEPTFNVSEEVRVRAQIDALDNFIWGSTPDYARSRADWNLFDVFSETQVPTQDSIRVRRVYGEVSTPVGIFRFGRMGSHWGLGMLRNDGNCVDCDFGDTVDRFQFVTEPFSGWFVAPMIDFNQEGPSSFENDALGQPWDRSQYDDAHSLVLAIARRDTEQQAKAKLDNGGFVLNGGIHFSYRTQQNAPEALTGSAAPAWVNRKAQLYVPDLWVKFERKQFRLELEAAAVLGSIGSRAQSFQEQNDQNGPFNSQALSVAQFGATLQAEFRALENKLKVGGEIGFASGDRAYGMGNYAGRTGSGVNGRTAPGDIDGPQFACPEGGSGDETTACSDNDINNFRFNRDYRIDMILWREILGGVTDAIYVKPTVDYEIAPGFNIFGAAIYSRTVFARSAPNSTSETGLRDLGADLGIEFNAGAKYETDDGFFFQLQWGLLIPLEGLKVGGSTAELDTAQALRGQVGIKF